MPVLADPTLVEHAEVRVAWAVINGHATLEDA